MSRESSVSAELLLLENCVDFQQHALNMALNTRRHIAILSTDLDVLLYDSDEFVTAISTLVRTSRYAQVQILVRNTQPLIERGHKLARLSQRLSSKLLLRKLTVEPENNDRAFMLCDSDMLLYKNDDQVYQGFANYTAAIEIKRLRTDFDYLWQYAEPEPGLQQLYI